MTRKQEQAGASTRAEHGLEAKDEALTAPRHPQDEHWGYSGLSPILLQLVRRPSRERGVCYEVRGALGALALFRSVSPSPGDARVVGHERVDVRPSELYRLVTAVDALSVPLRSRSEQRGVLDGVLYELAAFGDTRTVARLSWYAGHAPSAWGPLVSLVEQTIGRFDDATPPFEDDRSVVEPRNELGGARRDPLEQRHHSVTLESVPPDIQVSRPWRGPGKGVALKLRHLPTGVEVEKFIGYDSDEQHLPDLLDELLARLNGRPA